MDPATRTLAQVTIDDAAEADRTFSGLMGDDVGFRIEVRHGILDQHHVIAILVGIPGC